MELVLDNYIGGDVKEVKTNNISELEKIIAKYLNEHGENFITVRGIKSYIIDNGVKDRYNVYESTNPSNRKVLYLKEAVSYIHENINKK